MTPTWPGDLATDLRVALRLLARRPGFATVALVTLALGIGAPTAIFSVVHAVLLRPLPYPDADRIVRFRMESRGAGGTMTFDAFPVSTALDWSLSSDTLSDISVFNDRSLTLSTADGPFRLTGIATAPNLFAVLGVRPVHGDLFEKVTTDARQIILSHRTWLQYFGGRTGVVGSSITLDGQTYRVAGVMADEFRFPTAEAAFWVPLVLESGGGRGMLLPAIARLRPDATVPAVVEEGQRLLADTGSDREQLTLSAPTLHDQLVGGTRRLLWLLMAAVSLVSIIATTNIALLLLVRGAARAREFSIRLSIGAGRGQLMRQLFVEALLLAAIGGAGGVVLAAWLLELVVTLAPPDLPRLQDVTLRPETLLFAFALSLGTSVIFGLLSAGRTIGIDPVRALAAERADSARLAIRLPRRRLQMLAAVEIALTLVLLVGAGLLIRSLIGRVLIDQGFDGRGALVAQISLPPARYPTPGERAAFHERLLERLTQLPGARAAGIAVTLPNRQATARFDFGASELPAGVDPMRMNVAEVRTVSEGFFEAMGVPLLAGRTFRDSDRPGSEPVIVISQRLARLHYPDRPAVGEILYSRTGNRRVIGVVGDVKPATPDTEPSPSAYLTLRQDRGVFQWFAGMTLVVRGADPSAFAAPLRTLVLSLDPDVPPFNVRLLADDVSRLVAGPRFSASVLSAFALVALVLAAIGVYGVMAYSASQRTREIGVRIALGATRAQVLQLVVRDGMRVMAIGVIIGLGVAVWTAQALTGLLYEVQPADPLTLGAVAAILAAVGMVAVYVPARRATRINAVDALRH
jgi:putative ABC transport system permease protein